MTAVQRIENGLDRNGLMKLNNDLDKATSEYRGLIYIEAKRDQQDNSPLSWEKYLDGFVVNNKQVTKQYADRLIKAAQEQNELASENFKKVERQLSNSLNETEAELQLPKEPAVQMELRGDNALQKARNYKEIQEVLNKEKPSGHEIRAYNKQKREATKKLDDFTNKKKKETKQLPAAKVDPFTTDEEIDFETWCIEKHGFDVEAERPKKVRAIYALQEEKVEALFDRLPEWKKAYKEMASLCHPDKGGSTLAMSFLSDFKELMKALSKVRDIAEYENKIDTLREEYSRPKKK